MAGRHIMHVISHTHWDREWYLSFQRFRLRLVDLIDHLLDIFEKDPNFKYFNLDGQTIVLEDYLQIRPHKREILEKYIREGRILVGPWYQLNDEYLVSGESTVRSLLIGHRISKQFGDTMKVGYLPDQFGNISQMPQILNGFGIDNAIFGRGLQLADDRKMEFYWESPDGSTVLASLMAFWYNNAQHFPSDTDAAVGMAENIKNMMAPKSHTNHLLLMNGVDHLEAQPDVGSIIKKVNPNLKDAELVHSTLPNYFEEIKKSIKESGAKLDVIKGELREDREGSVLAGTLSARMYLKQANERCQTALEKYVEPSASIAYMLGGDYPQDFVTYAWKLLMQNHPHDSICGCSIDQVHYEMMPRFDQVQQVADELTGRALEYVANKIKTDGESLVVYNPLNWSRTDRVDVTIDLPLGDPARINPQANRDVPAIRIIDDLGNEVPYALIRSEKTTRQVLNPHELPLIQWVRRFEIKFVASDVPAVGYRTYKIEECDRMPHYDNSLAGEAYWDNAIANEYVRFSVNGGTCNLERLCMEDIECPISDFYPNMHILEDVGDVGDEYIHVKPINNTTQLSMDVNPKVSLFDHNPVSATLKVETSLNVPRKAIDANDRSECTVEIPVTSYFTVTQGVPRVDVKTVVHNQAEDHRLRVLFPSNVDTNIAFAEGQFDVLEREIDVPEDWPKASPFRPQQRWVDVNDGERGLCIINKGLPEYEVYRDDARTVALTLLRCVGHLSGGIAGGADMPGAETTPDAQCIGEYEFEYSIYPHSADWQTAQVWKQAHQHNIPLAVIQTGAHDGDLPKVNSFISTSHSELIISAIKKAEDSDMLVIRLYNPTSNDITGAWVKVNGAKSAKMLNMNEEIQGEVDFKDSAAMLEVKSKKIITLGFDLTK